MTKEHCYKANLIWTGNLGKGTSGYREYSRNHSISVKNKPDLKASSDPAFRGDPSCYNPEELLVISLSSCHLLWYLHLCADAGVVVLEYTDHAVGTMIETDDGGGKFKEVTLNPFVVVQKESMVEKAQSLHELAHKKCFIANSVNFPVMQKPIIHVK